MLNLRLICVGKLKESWLAAAFSEYAKRLGGFCRFETVELPEQRLGEDPSPKEISAALDREAVEIEKHLDPGAAVCAFCVEGRELSSVELADTLRGWMNAGKSRLIFVIGGSFGLSDAVKRRADLRLSVSRMTFPHHLFRVMAAEQLYRAFTILAGKKYHK